MSYKTDWKVWNLDNGGKIGVVIADLLLKESECVKHNLLIAKSGAYSQCKKN